jgi:hypothetical protein
MSREDFYIIMIVCSIGLVISLFLFAYWMVSRKSEAAKTQKTSKRSTPPMKSLHAQWADRVERDVLRKQITQEKAEEYVSQSAGIPRKVLQKNKKLSN